MKRLIKNTLRRWLPPALSERMVPPQRSDTWRGVYPSLKDVPTVDGRFDERLIVRMSALTRESLTAARSGRLPYTWHEPLALVAALAGTGQESLHVLDFGGGTGEGFVQLLASLPQEITIRYDVIELGPAATAGRELFADDERIRFSTDVPEGVQPDIVYANSVLQYIDDYEGALKRLARFDAPWLLLGQLATGRVKTFATQQVNVPGQILPYWFLDVDEVTAILAASGYGLLCQTLMASSYDQRSLPPELRIGRMRNMLFRRHKQR